MSRPDVSGWKVDEARHRLYLHGVGHVKYRENRPVRGHPKTIAVRREGRRWFVTVFCVNVPARPLPETGLVAGIDVGVAHLATVSDGTRTPTRGPASEPRTAWPRPNEISPPASEAREADADEHAAGNILRAGLAQREASRTRRAGRRVNRATYPRMGPYAKCATSVPARSSAVG